jgi:L-ascorbate metabolism protein UlaG (beta-lactamase superfamily)
MTFAARDLAGVSDLDARLAACAIADPWVESLYVNAFRDVFTHLREIAPAVALPYNCGTLIATRSGRLVGIDLTLLENYYDGHDWDVPDWLYGLITDRLDMLIVSHGHWDHCWVELVSSMIRRGKPVILPAGIQPCVPKKLPWGCRGVRDGDDFWWKGIHFAFHLGPHAYGGDLGAPVMTTRLWDGERAYLHTSDADTTNHHAFRWYDRYPIDVLCFKCGGVSPHVGEYDEIVHVIDRIQPRRLILPMHLNELGHRGTEAAMPFSRAYELLERYRAEGRLGDRRYAVLFGNRVVRF